MSMLTEGQSMSILTVEQSMTTGREQILKILDKPFLFASDNEFKIDLSLKNTESM